MNRWHSILLLFLAGNAFGQCQFNNEGDITNTNDPSCAQRMFTYTDTATGAGLIPLGYPVPVPVSSLSPVDGFRSYDSLLALHQDLALTNNDVRGDRIGQTLSGRDIWAYTMGDSDSLTTDGLAEPAVLVNGGIHAREWQSPETLSTLIETLAGNTDDQWLGSYLRDNLTVVLIPVLNIDGFLQTQAHPDRVSADPQQPREGRMRRRNLRNPQTSGVIDETIDTTGDNFWGVDLNRNSPRGWGLNGGSSSSVTSLIYRGASPSSEPEIQALQAAAGLAPAERLRLYMDVHSFTRIYLAPSTGNARRDNYTRTLANSMRAVQGFKYGYDADAPNGGIGLTSDYFAYTYNIPSWTLETEPLNGGSDYGGTTTHGHSGFILPDAEVDRMRNELLASSLIGFYRQSGPPHVVAVRVRDAVSGELRFVAEWLPGATRELMVSYNAALIPGNDYRLWLAFSKPMRNRNAVGEAVNYPGHNNAPGMSAVTLRVPNINEAGDLDVGLTAFEWHDQPDGTNDGYRQYVFDAASVGFTVPASLTPDSAEPAILRLSFDDMSGFALDGDPSTPVDWQNGAWSGLESEAGVAGDTGGDDCNFKPFIALDEQAAAPAGSVACASPSTPSPVPPAVNSGGGATAPSMLLLLFGLVCRRLRYMR